MKKAKQYGFIFKYEGLAILYMPDDDEHFLRFAAPKIYDVTEENKYFVMEVINDTNMSIKYSKTGVLDDEVWSFSEYRLFGEERIEDIVEYNLRLLRVTVGHFFRKIDGDDELLEEGDDDDNELLEDDGNDERKEDEE